MTYNEFISEGVLKDCDTIPKSLILQIAVMFPSTREQVHLVPVQTLLSPILFFAKTTKTNTTRFDMDIRLILIYISSTKVLKKDKSGNYIA